MLSAEQIIKTICKDLSDSPSLSVYLQMAEESLNSRFFGKLYQHAKAYKACHLFTIYGADSEMSDIAGVGVNPISGVKEGGLSVNFGSGSGNSDSSLSTTKYGKMLLDLIKSRPTADVNRNNLLIVYPYIL